MDTATPLTALDVARSILAGEYDDDLATISEAARQRRKDVSAREAKLNGMTLKPGDRVTLHGLSPKLLNGAVVEVTRVDRTRVLVKPIDDVTDFLAAQRLGHGSRVPLQCVTRVD